MADENYHRALALVADWGVPEERQPWAAAALRQRLSQIDLLEQETQALTDALAVTRGAANTSTTQAQEAWDLLRQAHRSLGVLLGVLKPEPWDTRYDEAAALHRVLGVRLAPSTAPQAEGES